MRIASVNVGRPREVTWRGRVVKTAIFKEPVEGPVAVRRLNIDGDGQADLTVHGGEHKAVYAYAVGHYTRWAAELPGHPLGYGAFGENLTIDDFVESDIRVGDRFRAGTASFVVTQARLPCYKLNLRHDRNDMIDRMIANGMAGFYLAVAEEGVLETGVAFDRIATSDDAITIADAVHLYTGASTAPALLRRAIQSPGLSDSWRERFRRVLESHEPAAG